MTLADLFGHDGLPATETLAPGAMLLRGFVGARDTALLDAVDRVVERAPLRHLITPGGLRMSVAMTNCGTQGWVSDRRGYRYEPRDPLSGEPWPAMPAVFLDLAIEAAAAAGFASFAPNACLINRYEPGTRLTLHQDRDELDFTAPIVSVSLGIPAAFLFGGNARTDMTVKLPLLHGDVAVWGGPSRLRFHGVAPLKPALHPRLGASRINLTFRQTGQPAAGYSSGVTESM